MEKTRLDDTVLALLFASDEPLSPARICGVLDDVAQGEVRESLARLEDRFGAEGSAIRVEHVAGGYQLCTNPAYADCVALLYRGRRKQRLSRAAMETLAIIAYRQPVTRADIENIRGVACGGVITTLMERSLIRIVGKARVLGAPFLYGTTQEFLEYLGLNALGDLPSLEDLEALLEKEAASETAEEPGEDAGAGVPESVDESLDGPRETPDAYEEEPIAAFPGTEEGLGSPEDPQETPPKPGEIDGNTDTGEQADR